jgi:hypothetical protein
MTVAIDPVALVDRRPWAVGRGPWAAVRHVGFGFSRISRSRGTQGGRREAGGRWEERFVADVRLRRARLQSGLVLRGSRV